MANILLIYPKPEENKNPRFAFSLNLLYLSSILKDNGHCVLDYFDFSLCDCTENAIYSKLDSSDYVIVEMDSFSLKRSSNARNAVSFLEKIKRINPSIKTISFGHDISIYPREIPFSDYTLPSYNYESEILTIINEGKKPLYCLKDFDALPFPDRKLLSNYIEHGGTLTHKPNLMKSTLIQTSRGCLNKCTFCQRKGWQDTYLAHSVDYVLSEFQVLRDNNYINIWISDDNFTFNLKRAKNILSELIKQNISKEMKISCSSWIKIDREFLELAKEANISIISFGIESADKEILNFYKKSVDLECVSNLISFANNIGLYVIGNFIIGAPMETKATIAKTFRYAIDTSFDQVNIKILDYMRGAELFELLPDDVKGNKSHIFASKETGLNNFYLSELREQINIFKEKFNKNRIGKIKEKILKYGSPYALSDNNYMSNRG